jgi:phosphoribosylanthranilate isomerase
MSVRVKICGLNDRAACEAALAARADFGGLVFFPASPRHVGLDRARDLAALLRGRVRVVTLMVDPSDGEVEQLMAAVAPDFLQLHGKETPARVAAVASLAKRPVIKAIAVADAADVARAYAYEEVAEYILFDAKADIAASRPGGLGAAFDWQLLTGTRFKRPWGLAGGLNAENIARAIRIARPEFVDASSGVEDAPGKKSVEKIAAFVTAARNALYTDYNSGEKAGAA